MSCFIFLYLANVTSVARSFACVLFTKLHSCGAKSFFYSFQLRVLLLFVAPTRIKAANHTNLHSQSLAYFIGFFSSFRGEGETRSFDTLRNSGKPNVISVWFQPNIRQNRFYIYLSIFRGKH